MRFNGALADPQIDGHALVCVSTRDPFEDVSLPRRQEVPSCKDGVTRIASAGILRVAIYRPTNAIEELRR